MKPKKPKFIGQPGSLFHAHMTGNKQAYQQADEVVQMAWRIANGLRYDANRKVAPMAEFDESHKRWLRSGKE